MNFDEKHSPNVLENQTRLQNSTDTTRKSLIFRELCALFEKKSISMNRDILKHPTRSGAKNNKLCAPSHLVTCFPRLKSQCIGGPNDCSKFMNRVIPLVAIATKSSTSCLDFFTEMFLQ